LEDRNPIAVNKDNFDDVLKGQNLSLDIVVPNKLSEDPEAASSVHLDFKTLKDFEPDAVAQSVPELKSLMDVRDALKALKGPLANIPDFRKKIQEIIKNDDARAQLLASLELDDPKS
jgi:type VI secretion system protein ImpB